MQEGPSDIDTLEASASKQEEVTVKIEPLGSHPRGNFCCGVSRIDNFFKNNARRDNEAYKVRVFVATRGDDDTPVGFYSLTLTALEPAKVSDKANRKFQRVNAVPGIYLAMIGVHEDFQGCGIGRALMQDAITRALLISENAGAYALILDALNERVAKFYKELGFEPFVEGDLKMYLELSAARAAGNPI